MTKETEVSPPIHLVRCRVTVQGNQQMSYWYREHTIVLGLRSISSFLKLIFIRKRSEGTSLLLDVPVKTC